jgi:transposase
MLKPKSKTKRKRFISNSDVVNRIVSLYTKDGMSAPQIAKEIVCSSLTVLNILRSQGVEIRNRGTYPKKIKTINQIDDIFKDYENGDSLSVIASRYGVKPNTIYYHMKKHDRETRSNRKLSGGDIEFIEKKCQNGVTKSIVKKLADKFGITKNAIRYHIKKLNK